MSSHAQRLGAASSRFVDDLTFSGLNPAPLVQIAGKQLSTRGLQIHRKKARFQPKAKLKITPNWQRQEVTGLVVNSKAGPSVSRTYRDNVRGAIHALRKETDTKALDKAVRSGRRGKIAYISQFNPGAGKRLTEYLEAIQGQGADSQSRIG